MFVQHTFIEESHKATLASVIAQHALVTEPLLVKLYRAAHDLFAGQAVVEAGLHMQFVKNAENGIVAGATDDTTGIFVQLSGAERAEEHTSELQSIMRISYAVFCLKQKNKRELLTQ